MILGPDLNIKIENEIAKVAKGGCISTSFNVFASKLKEAIHQVY